MNKTAAIIYTIISIISITHIKIIKITRKSCQRKKKLPEEEKIARKAKRTKNDDAIKKKVY